MSSLSLHPISISISISTTMEIVQAPPQADPTNDYHSNVDTSSPFRSVKEAVAIFGERFLTPQIYSPKPFSFPKQEIIPTVTTQWKFSPIPPQTISEQSLFHSIGNDTVAGTLKKLENELQETKQELKLLKERETENEVALASLNAELHKNMSKIAQAEAVVAGKAAVASRDLTQSTKLAHILSFSQEKEVGFGEKTKEKKMNKRKKKPIIPLVGDLFWKKKGSSTTLHNPLYSSSSHVNWN